MERVGLSPRLVERLEKKALGIQDNFTTIGAVKQIEFTGLKARRGTENKALESGGMPHLLSPMRLEDKFSRNHIGSTTVAKTGE